MDVFPFKNLKMMQKKLVLIKYGGNAMLNRELKKEIAHQVKSLISNNIEVVLVHGGGPFINKALDQAGITSEFIEGHRFTTQEALIQIETTLKGEVNSDLVGIFNNTGLKAVGLSGKDGKMVIAEKRYHLSSQGEKIDLGQVGNIQSINCDLIKHLLKANFTPIVTCIGSDEDGQDYNINADMFAGHLSSALRVDEYIVLTDVDGLYKNFPDPDSIIPEISLPEIPALYKSIITGGMIPKIESCEIALKHGAKKAVIINGTKPFQIESYSLFQQKVGTTITQG